MWLPGYLYAMVRRCMPIACVDVLPYEIDDRGDVWIYPIVRDGEDGRRKGLALVGGRVRHGEDLLEAIGRHVHTTFGPHVTWTPPDVSRPEVVAQYFPQQRPDAGFDPRQHAIALSYPLEIHGSLGLPAGSEAHDIVPFLLPDRPGRRDVVFQQGHVVDALIAAVEDAVARRVAA
jgi:ADP-ribose pyrophosphatase YjhB (NUDIX family)